MSKRRPYVIHVHQQRIRQGLPAVIIRSSRGGKTLGYHTEVKLSGDVRVVQPDSKLSCGARVWIEAEHAECACPEAEHQADIA
jgi:hypothetical protein